MIISFIKVYGINVYLGVGFEMRIVNVSTDIKRANRVKLMKYLLDNGGASRQELVQALELSSPTVIQIIKELAERGLITEVGEYNSTGGRKAKALGVTKGMYFAVGAEITKHHLQLVLVDMNHEVLAAERIRYPYQDVTSYYVGIGNYIQQFLQKNGISEENGNTGRVLGVGVSIPGTINTDDKVIWRSITLNITDNTSTSRFTQYIPYRTFCAQNSENAAFAEAKHYKSKNMVCLFLNDAVSGAAYLDHKVYTGDRNKGTIPGHMILVPGGRQCYCGKKGCVNTYCSALTLRRSPDTPLEDFFEAMNNGNEENARIWDEYLDYLAIAVSNLRICFECDVLLGGSVSEYVKQYRAEFDERLMRNSIFEEDTAYIHFGKYKREVFAIGAAFVMIEKSIESSDLLG